MLAFVELLVSTGSGHMPIIAEFLELRFPGGGPRRVYRRALELAVREFLDSGMADRKYEIEFLSGSEAKFWSCLSEAFVYQRIKHLSLPQRLNIGEGPDFLVQTGGVKVWIEVVCPEPSGIPSDWLEIQFSKAGSVPNEAILLRWTSAIKDKTEKLVGRADAKVKGYLRTGIVSERDVYVIAVNGCRMRHGPFPALHGISQFPYAVEAVFPVGPYQIRIDRHSLRKVGAGHQTRFHIPKPNGSKVSTYAFLDPNFQQVSAVWALDCNGASVIGNSEPSALIFNPNAVQPLPRGLLVADDEFLAVKTGEDEYTLSRHRRNLD